MFIVSQLRQNLWVWNYATMNAFGLFTNGLTEPELR